ncbi:hypothetical protein [Streptomyces sp. NBC_00299]|uniref:hypothetical protein n=1 Tax=Streptomyces sp. NBC_00299 TaxID=2975705 RepID=UPI002E2A95E1|nr:hypothetical protein [Streptomyces sp. NBC_00299]
MSMSMWRHGVGKTFMAAVAVAVVGGVLPSSASAHAVAAGAATSPAAQASDAVPAQAEAASTLAAQTGEPVEVLFERTEYSEVFAQPDGSFKLTQSTAPQRVRASDGSWKPVDVTLAKRADGRIAPKAAVVDLSFSGKGAGGDLIRIGDRNSHTLTLGWDPQARHRVGPGRHRGDCKGFPANRQDPVPGQGPYTVALDL